MAVFRFSAVCAAAIGLFVSGAALAQSSTETALPFPGKITGSVALTSDYIYRGISQTDEHPALQGSVMYEHPAGPFVSLWGSNVDFNDGDEASVEIDITAGYAGKVGNFSYKLGGIYYWYPGAEERLGYDFIEAYTELGYDFGFAALQGSVNYSPDFFANTGDAFYFKLGGSVPLPLNFKIGGHIGYQTIQKNTKAGIPDYWDWGLGVTYSIAGFDLDARYYDTDINIDNGESRFVFSVSRAF